MINNQQHTSQFLEDNCEVLCLTNNSACGHYRWLNDLLGTEFDNMLELNIKIIHMYQEYYAEQQPKEDT